MNHFINHLTDIIETIINFTIRKANHLNSITFQNVGTRFIVLLAFSCIMLCSINFYHQSRLMAVKIHDKVIYDSLLIYFYGIMP